MKKYFLKTSLLLCLLLILGLAGCENQKVGPGAPSAIAWNNLIYSPSGTEVSQSEFGKQLGEIKQIKKPMPMQNGDSNYMPVGSKITEIKGIDTNEAIAIEKEGKIYKFIKIGMLEK
ncbi:hypothetical protein [Clostridium sp.]|uniref:hypothetical protein n=1 Tax=Clostridium sp. TaxID=1506 RepID=UPI002FC925D8